MFYTPSSQKVEDKKEKKIIYRDEYMDSFDKVYSSSSKENILMYYGIGGIGKSTLLETIEKKVTKDENSIIIKYDFDDKNFTQTKVYEEIIISLLKAKKKIKYLPILFAQYWKKANPNSEFKESKLPFVEEGTFLGDMLSEISGEEMLALGGASVNVLHKIYKRAAKEVTFSKSILAELNSHKDASLEELLTLFPIFLAYDLEEIRQKNDYKFLFLFDTYEKIGANINTGADTWIKDLIYHISLKENSQISSNALFIFAGREELAWESGWNPYILHHEILNLSHAEITQMLQNAEVLNENFAQSVIELSKGQPFYVDLAIEMYKKEPNKDDLNLDGITTNEIFERFVRYLSTEELTIIEILSVPRHFDMHLYKYLLHEFKITYPDSLSDDLMNYSFFKKRDERYSMHDLMRDSIELNLAKKEIQKINQVLFNWYENIVEKLEYKNISERNLDNFSEYVYHLLKRGDNSSVIEIYKEKIEAKLELAGKYHFLVELTSNLIKSMKNEEFKTYLLIQLVSLYNKIDDKESAADIIEELTYRTIAPDLYNNYTYVVAYYEDQFTPTHKQKEKFFFENILKQYTKAIKNAPTEIKLLSLIRLSNIYRKNRDLINAKKHLMEAYTLSQNENSEKYLADIYDKLHFVYRDQNDFEKALDNTLKALEIRNKQLHSKHLKIGKNYRDIANFLFSYKKYSLETKKYMLKSLKIYSYYYDSTSSEVFFMYQKLGLILLRLEEVDDFLENIPSFIDPILLKIALIKKDILDESSLRAIYEIAPSERVSILTMYARYAVTYDKEKAVELYEEILLTTSNLHEKVNILFFCARVSANYSFLKAESYYLKYLQAVEETEDLYLLFKANTYLYAFYYKDNTKAQFYAQQQLEISQKISLNQKYKYRAYSSLVHSCKKNQKLKEKYLWNIYETAKEMQSTKHILESLKSLYYFYKAEKNVEAQFKILDIQEEYTREKKIFPFLDITYAIKAKIYAEENDFKNVELYYDKQIELRKRGTDHLKLAKGYLFKADLYPVNGDHYKYYLDKGLEILVEHNEQEEIYKYIEYYMKFCSDTLEKKIEYMEKRLTIAREINSKSMILNSLDELSRFYISQEDSENSILYLQKKIDLLHGDEEYLKEYSQALTRIVYIKLANNETDGLHKLQLKRVNAELKLGNRENIKNLLSKMNHHYSKEEMLSMYKMYMGQFFSQGSIKPVVPLIEEYYAYVYKLRDKKEMALFWKSLSKHIKKVLDLEYRVQIESYNQLLNLNNRYLSNFIYDHKVEAKIAYNKKNYDNLRKILIDTVEYFDHNDKRLYAKYRDKYNNFETRMSKLFLVNGEILYSKLKPIIEEIDDIPASNQEIFFMKLKEILEMISRGEEFEENLSTKGLELTYVTQVLGAKVDNFSELNYGFHDIENLLRYACFETDLKLIELNINSQIKYRLAFKTNDNYESLEPISSYSEYVHSSRNYAKLISKMFFNGDGVFVPMNMDILFESLAVLDTNKEKIQEITIDEIINICVEELANKNYNELIISNIVYSLYYSGAFNINIKLRAVVEQKLTLKELSVQELLLLLKEYAKEKLNGLYLKGEFQEVLYDMLWMKKSVL